MNKLILLTLLLCLCTAKTSAQTVGTNTLTLPRLELRVKSMETILSDIDAFIGNKPNGLHFPISKIVFSQLDDLTCFDVVGIDNSWTNLFKFGEVPYGYLIIHNRLYLVSALGYEDVDLTPYFYLTNIEKSFNRSERYSTGINKNPTWFFEYRNNQSYLISVTDLEVLN